jgi:hypothetical protein
VVPWGGSSSPRTPWQNSVLRWRQRDGGVLVLRRDEVLGHVTSANPKIDIATLKSTTTSPWVRPVLNCHESFEIESVVRDCLR